ncbi:ATP-binding protein [Rhizobium ruizarguesonis]|uniref:ATP-binding protein n=1 Tax=Rhizobium ruizarguesonis TaxID=2081791 RepID=UPI00102FA731|nr:ATP-binding protein [Rhizobium ruizarguesonis]TAZ73894.1 ATP-binding protein [Rhizobium ruizarguesonis]TBA00496.1 ATP-binding protein [Rhizobium ruizarguesonis]
MPRLAPNVINRVDKLPKPSNTAQAMQPLFEAVSNAIFAIEDVQETQPDYQGIVDIYVTGLRDPDKLAIEVIDNGIGLDENRYGAFCQLDTDFKKERGGKGVGRLFWLDSFKDVRVESRYLDNDDLHSRAFAFLLNNEEQLREDDQRLHLSRVRSSGTVVVFKGLREANYRKQFPASAELFKRYFSAHFIADFLMARGAAVRLDIDGEEARYPEAVSDLVVGEPLEDSTVEHKEFGVLKITGFTCKPEASTGLDGMHQLHLLADGRNVEPRKIDKLLGIDRVRRGDQNDLVFHGCVTGEYLNRHVNEGRTAFNLGESKVKELIRFCTELIKERFLTEQIAEYSEARREDYRGFVQRYPIYDFADEDTQLDRVPFGARSPEEFATGLVKYQIRRDETRQKDIEDVIKLLEEGQSVSENFAETVIRAAQEVQNSERLALAQHVVRRKLVLELLDRLVRRIRDRGDKEEDFHLESTLHSLIVPMRLSGVDPSKVEASNHDLWIVDERLAFTRSFSSDQRIAETLKSGGTDIRPDLLVWNLAHGLGVVDPSDDNKDFDASEPLRKAMIVEFKRPGRTQYKKAEDLVELQITKYLRQLKNGEIETFNRQSVRIAPDCIFYCYVVADIRGDLKEQLAGWSTTTNGEGRIRSLDNEFKGSTIEVVQWQDLVNDAWARNVATLHAAGLSRSPKTKG